MGMWQPWAACNIIQRPIVSVFPVRGSPEFRADFNQKLVPIDSRFRSHEPLNIMWTPVSPNGHIIHFVPLLKKMK